MRALHALISHHYWNRAGGGEIVCAGFAKVFDVLGFTPLLVSPIRIDVSRYSEWFGVNISAYPTFDLGFELKAFGMYTRLLEGLTINKALKKFDVKIVFKDNPVPKSVVSVAKRSRVRLVEYIHFPVEVFARGGWVQFEDDPYHAQRYSRFPMNIYFKLYLSLLSKIVRDNPFTDLDLVLANSEWSANIVKSVYGEKPVVLNPPIPPNVGVVENPKTFEAREDIVVMIGRFGVEKRYHWVVQEVFPRLKKVVNNVKLYVFGSSTTKSSRDYYKRVVSIASKLGLKVSTSVDDGNAEVYIIENAPRATIISVMDRAKAFLHATINEHWGVAVSEAMARGLSVVVHKSGGPWSDLVMEGVHGLGYATAEEAVEVISKLLTDSSTWSYYSGKAVERVKGLTFNKFIEKAIQLIKKIL
jgi:glycosyltransferase involved in cell wall biosynthesis